MKFLQDYMEDKQTALFNKTGAFFAFSKEQIDKGLLKAGRPSSDYFAMGHGMLCPKENAKELMDSLDTIYKDSIAQDIEENGALAICKREYDNHETGYTFEAEQAIDAIEEYITSYPNLFNKTLLRHVFKGCYVEERHQKYFA